MDAAPHSKRRCRRGVVSASTIAHVPLDTWLIICANSYRAPHTVFRLMMASKAVCDALRGQTPAWWTALFLRVCHHQSALRHSNTLKTLRAYGARTHLPAECILRAVFSARCAVCGCRKGHRLLRPHALRVCGPCLRANLISNVALARDYGVAFCDLLERYVHERHGPLIALDGFRPRLAALVRLTTELPSPPLLRRGSVFFLWRPLLGLPLDALAEQQRLRRAAAGVLSAAVRRRGCRALGATPLLPHPAWIPGGPFHSFTGHVCYSRRRVARLMSLMQPKCVRALGWFPPLPPPRPVHGI